MAQANIKAVITAEDRASGALRGFGRSVENMGANILSVAKRSAIALGAAAAAATGFAVKSAADFEQTRIGLENMLGSADKARAMLVKVSDFAAQTPFEFPELAQATRQLVAFGFTGNQAFETMKQLGDVSAAIGAPINDLAYLMGTLRAQGRAFTIDIRQFAQRGIPIYEYLAKVFKTNTKEVAELIEAGKVGFPEVQKAFQMMTAEGGKFHNTMARQSKSLSGLFSTLKDNIGIAARELVGITEGGDIKPGSLFEKLQTSLNWLNKNLPRIIDNIKNAIGQVAPILAQWARNIADAGRRIGEYLLPKLKDLAKAIRDIGPEIKDFWDKYLNPILVAIGTGIVLLVGLIIDITKQFVKFAERLYQDIAPQLNNIKNDLLTEFIPALQELWRMVSPVLVPAIKILGKVIGVVLIEGVRRGLGALTLAMKFATEFLKIIRRLISRVATIPQRFYHIGRDLVMGLVNGAKSGAKAIEGYFSKTLPGRIVGVFKRALGIESPSKVFSQLGQYIGQGLINGIGGTEKTIKSKIRGILDKILTDSKNKYKEILNKQKDFIASTKQTIMQGADITQAGGETPTIGSVIGGLQAEAGKVKSFYQNIKSLFAKGLSRNFIEQILAGGVEGGGGIASLLAGSSKADIKQINQLQGTIGRFASGTARFAGNEFFGDDVRGARQSLRETTASVKNININIGLYAGSQMEKRKIAEELMNAYNDLRRSRGRA